MRMLLLTTLVLASCSIGVRTAPGISAAPQGPTAPSRLDAVKNAKCVFGLMTQGTLVTGESRAEIKPLTKPLQLEFEAIDVDSGTAKTIGAMAIDTASQDVIAQRRGKYLHFVHILRDGPLYTTTVIDQPTRDGKYLAIHTRHEYNQISVPGFPSKPEQYYGECALIQ
jgi:hypothetical protein